MCAGVVTARKICLEHTKLKRIATEQKGKEQAGHDAGCGSTANRMYLDHKRASAQAQATQRNNRSSIDKDNRAAAQSLTFSHHHASHIPLPQAERAGGAHLASLIDFFESQACEQAEREDDTFSRTSRGAGA